MTLSEIRITLSLFASFFAGFSIPSNGEPFVAPHDPFFRHELLLLGDSDEISGMRNSWPVDLGALETISSEGRLRNSHRVLRSKLSSESESGWSPVSFTIGFSDDRVTARGFGPELRSGFSSNTSVSWMSDRFAAKLSLNAFYEMENDWKGRKDEGLALDGSYLAVRLGNWSASLGMVDRWWGPGWDGSLILSTNARPIPAISIDRRVSEPFDSKWLSWLGPWSFHSFIGRLEEERTVPNPYLWGMRGEVRPTFLEGLEVGFFRIMQLGGKGRPEGLSTWTDAFLSQDNFGANTGNNDRSMEPGNQLAGIDFRLKVFDAPVALYGQVVGEDEDNFLPNALMFQYGVEGWRDLGESSLRIFAEYADLTSYWWTGDPRTRNISYGHHIYLDGYRYRGRPIGHWGDQDSQILSIGGMLQLEDAVGWGSNVRKGKLNEDGSGENSVSNGVSSDYFSFDLFNSREYPNYDLKTYTSLGWESVKDDANRKSEGLCAYLSLTHFF